MTPPDHVLRMKRARASLDGLSVGDGFGELFFRPHVITEYFIPRLLPPSPWRTTDDTAMALSIVEVLERYGHIDQDALARAFAERHRRDPARGYGGGAHRLLAAIAEGAEWRSESAALFDGSGSYGNGGAMRVAPLGAYFADDVERAADEARLSAEVTHSHTEGIAGAVAVAVAASVVGASGDNPDIAERIFEAALRLTPASATRDGIHEAQGLGLNTSVAVVAKALGTGSMVSSQDTVPFCLWCASKYMGDFADAMWATVGGFGDRDTTCAIVGGIVAASGVTIPEAWLTAREALS